MFKRKKNEQEAMEAENAIGMRSPLDEWNDSQQDDLGAKPKKRFFFQKEKGEKPEKEPEYKFDRAQVELEMKRLLKLYQIYGAEACL